MSYDLTVFCPPADGEPDVLVVDVRESRHHRWPSRAVGIGEVEARRALAQLVELDDWGRDAVTLMLPYLTSSDEAEAVLARLMPHLTTLLRAGYHVDDHQEGRVIPPDDVAGTLSRNYTGRFREQANAALNRGESASEGSVPAVPDALWLEAATGLLRADAVIQLFVDEPGESRPPHDRQWRLLARAAAPDASWPDGRVRPLQAVLVRGRGPADGIVATRLATAMAHHHGQAGVLRALGGSLANDIQVEFHPWRPVT